jgi:CubicO group peptidase (beta-lactamase class C family)
MCGLGCGSVRVTEPWHGGEYFFCFLFCLALVSTTAASPLDPAKLGQIDVALQKAIDEHRLPGAVVWVEHGGEIYWKAYGKRSLVPTVETMTPIPSSTSPR